MTDIRDTSAVPPLAPVAAPAPVAEILDLDALNTTNASNAGAEIQLLHPVTSAPTGIFITLLGKDSDVFRDHMKERVNQRVRKEAFAARRNKQLDPMTAEQTEQDAIELLALCTLGWRSTTPEKKDAHGNTIAPATEQPIIRHKGEDLAFNANNAMRIYRELIWVRRQVDEAIGDLENFMKA